MPKLESFIRQIEPVKVTGPQGSDVLGVASDSRQIRPGYVFVALAGSKRDGRTFIDDAVDRGAIAVVTECGQDRERDKTPGAGNGAEAGSRGRRNDVCHIKVNDAHLTVALLAAAFYDRPSGKLQTAGVTGTNGKTTIAYMTREILRAAGRKPGMISTVEYEIGARKIPAGRTTPEATALQSMLAEMVSIGCQSVVMEVSSHGLAQKRTAGIDYDVAAFTNLTRDHLDYHGTMENYFEAKCLLFRQLGRGEKRATAVINRDDPYGRRIIETVDMTCQVLTYGMEGNADIRAERVTLSSEGSAFRACTPWGDTDMRLRLMGRHNISNALAAAGMCGSLGVKLDCVASVLAGDIVIPGRLEEVRTGKDFQVFVDYAHTDDALQHVLQTLREITKGRLVAVFGCGGDRDKTKRPVMGAVAARLADYTVLTSDNPRTENPLDILNQIREGFGTCARYEVIEDRALAIKRALEIARKGDIVLIAGKGHETFQEFENRTVPFEDRKVVGMYL